MLEQIVGKKKYTETEMHIVNYVEQNPRRLIDLSLEELARECFVSQASIIRFCKKTGCKGFSDFKILIARELQSFVEQNEKIEVDLPIPEGINAHEIADVMLKLTERTLDFTFNALDYNMLQRSANLLAHADLIHIYGRGESQIIAEDFHYKLLRIGLHSSLEPMNGFGEAKCLRNDSRIRQVALLVSHYCNSRQVHYIIDELNCSQIPFILLTAAEDAFPYEGMASAVLRVHSNESRFKMGSFSSRTAMMYVLDCLYALLFSADYEANKNNLVRFAQRKIERSYFYNASSASEAID